MNFRDLKIDPAVVEIEAQDTPIYNMKIDLKNIQILLHRIKTQENKYNSIGILVSRDTTEEERFVIMNDILAKCPFEKVLNLKFLFADPTTWDLHGFDYMTYYYSIQTKKITASRSELTEENINEIQSNIKVLLEKMGLIVQDRQVDVENHQVLFFL